MKYCYLFILSIYALSALGQETSVNESCYLKIIYGEESTTYHFDRIIDLEQHFEKLLEDFILPDKKSKKGNTSEPEVAISITCNQITVKETITANPECLKKVILKLKNQLNIPSKE